jgi:hypothetical protein
MSLSADRVSQSLFSLVGLIALTGASTKETAAGLAKDLQLGENPPSCFSQVARYGDRSSFIDDIDS